jgi:hypothetical protein
VSRTPGRAGGPLAKSAAAFQRPGCVRESSVRQGAQAKPDQMIGSADGGGVVVADDTAVARAFGAHGHNDHGDTSGNQMLGQGHFVHDQAVRAMTAHFCRRQFDQSGKPLVKGCRANELPRLMQVHITGNAAQQPGIKRSGAVEDQCDPGSCCHSSAGKSGFQLW